MGQFLDNNPQFSDNLFETPKNPSGGLETFNPTISGLPNFGFGTKSNLPTFNFIKKNDGSLPNNNSITVGEMDGLFQTPKTSKKNYTTTIIISVLTVTVIALGIYNFKKK